MYTQMYLKLLKRYNYCGDVLAEGVADGEMLDEYYQELQLCESLMYILAEVIE